MIRTLMLTAALLLPAAAAFADDAHHPPETSATPAPAPASPPATPTAPESRPGTPGSIMGPGMMGPGMMGPGMMQMMQGRMRGMGGMMAPERIEGRIAFLRAELRITEAQQPQWNAFAEALRANARSISGMMTSMRAGMMSGGQAAAPALPQRLEAYERMLDGRLESLRRLRAALTPLYAALDDAQKRTADELIMPGPMGSM